MKQTIKTEQRILDAARKLFILKGYQGTTMKNIAKEANVNNAALHYYFRSKNKLFDLIFDEVLTLINTNLTNTLNANINFEEKIRQIVTAYINILIKHPYFPDFVIHELSCNPERIETIVKKHNLVFKSFLRFQIEIKKELKSRNRSNIKPFELVLNIASLCVFPFLSKPIITRISNSFDEAQFEQLMNKRKTDIAELIIKSITD